MNDDICQIDDILAPWQSVIGRDFQGYRNHVVRMVTFCQRLRVCRREDVQKLVIAGCFHDIGLWTRDTLDYLPPSLPPAAEYLAANGLSDWLPEIEQMILLHHKLRPVEDGLSPLVELFRQGDLVDFSLGRVCFSLSRAEVREVQGQYPNAGFHRMLLRRSWRWFLRHPLNPAPMMKW
ncbi:HD domain-containing protein [Marinobacter mobilis]|uniref:HD domain-containing protein n=1 Tax=Marinobacter mobilis TaxID=488533 RepID=UPI0035C70BF9